MTIVTEDDWVTSSMATGYGSVEVRFLEGGGVEMRDSAHPCGPKLLFTRDEWLAFTEGAKAGEFDDL